MTTKWQIPAGAVLVGDIGGTNARFSMVSPDRKQTQAFPTNPVADFSNIDETIDHNILPLAREKPQSLILAMAGPVEGDVIPLTNSHWFIDANALIKQFDLQSVLVINDFEAQALATTALEPTYLRQIGPGAKNETGSRVILGPGTGLGVAALAHVNTQYLPIAGEGGHIDFAPRTARDFELFPHLRHIEGRISMEEVLSGRGLVGIYHAICKTDGIQPVFDQAEGIAHAAHQQEHAQAEEAIQLFLTWLARFAGDIALIFKAHGGVYIGGGIVPKIIGLLDEKTFRQAFEDKAPHSKLLADMPVFVMTHPRAALEGIAAYVRMPDKFLLDYNNRLWSR